MSLTLTSLSPDLREKIRSGFAISSCSQCVQELVHNALDAGSSKIDVSLDLPCLKIRVSDDGTGLGVADLQKVAERYTTSKCRRLRDLDSVCTLGYRGEALASLREMSGFLQIVSKLKTDSQAHVALFLRGERKRLTSFYKDFGRPTGTTVSVLDLLHNFPVRQQSMSPALDVEECRRVVEALALARPEVSFTLTDDSSGGRRILQTEGGWQRRENAFCSMFGQRWLSTLRSAREQRDPYALSGFVSSEGAGSKTRQFLCVNGRPVTAGGHLFKVVRTVLKKSVMCRQPQRSFHPDQRRLNESPTKSACMHAVFYLDLSCPRSQCEVLLDPKKTSVEFSDWPAVCAFVQESLMDFLRRHNLLPPSVLAEEEAAVLTGASAPVTHPLPPLPHDITGIVPLSLVSTEEEEDGEKQDDTLGCEPLEFEAAEKREERGFEEICDASSEYFTNVEGARVSKVVRKRKSQGLVANVENEKRKCTSLDSRGHEDGSEENSAKDEAVLPEGWIKKESDGSKTFFVQVRSGMTVDNVSKCCNPGKTNKATSEKRMGGEGRLEVLPAGKTPFISKAFGDKVKILAKATTTDEDSSTCTHSKWRDERAHSRENINTLASTTHVRSASEMVAAWQNPVFVCENAALDLRRVREATRQEPSTFRFERSMFEGLEVVGQVDKKFIAGKITQTSGQENEDRELLIFFDQHAVHERIRLERLIKENYPGQKVLSRDLEEPVEVTLNPDESRILSHFVQKVRKFGLEVTVRSDGGDKEEGICSSLASVDRVPVCFLQREASELKYNRSSPLRDLVLATLRDLVQTFRVTRGAGPTLLPKTIFNVLSSQACRSAVKFGDKLNPAVCRRLLDQLSACGAPFQCAHGRPSLAPIADVTKLLSVTPDDTEMLNLTNLRSLMVAQEDEED